MGDQTKQARLDNWAMFVMSRLQVFFNTTDYCDLTLQFEGNVQLKVHRVIMNACTEYFRLLEQECDMDGDVLIMPPDLQADVILPIVNFMYTGILEYQHSIFERLYQTAELMNMTVLLKFLDAQRAKLKSQRVQQLTAAMIKRPVSIKTEKLPQVMPGRKLPIWKRKTAPLPVQINPVKPYSPESRSIAGDASRFDNAPKPTRFEWPDDDIQDIKPFDLLPLDSSFDSISYSSKPLMTQEEEMRSSCNSNVFDDLRQLPGGKVTKKAQDRDKDSYSLNSSVDMEDLKSYVKEQKIRSGLADFDDEEDPDDPDYVEEPAERSKRKSPSSPVAAKKPKVSNEKENIVEVRAAGKMDHSKIISEVIKKYPHLVSKNKNIRLKILAKNKGDEKEKEKPAEKERPKLKAVHVATPANTAKKALKTASDVADVPKKMRAAEQTWECSTCTNNGEPMEFVLYYLYRKHMTDAHHRQFDARECKHCGELYELPLQMTYHMYMAHAVVPPRSVNFPKCARCSFVAYDKDVMGRHAGFHEAHGAHVQCPNCKLGFTGSHTLKAHMQLAGHNGKNQLSFDCQYCTRQLNSATSLFVHCKTTHAEDAKRDGMLSLDEEHLEGQPSLGAVDEKISSEETQDAGKMPPPPQPSSLDETANIASSLGAFDIVVLDDQQQYILQGEQDAPAAITTQQSYMTLPSLQDQPYISQADIGSTDELVMVLTDHDYNDGSDNIINANDNSNIVVLYSHPVDGQQNQFITSQGNIMLNSETGMLEIHNDGVPLSAQGESIEMIQKEIQNSMSTITSSTETQSIVTSAVEVETPPEPASDVKCEKGNVEEQEKLINAVEEPETDPHQDTTDFAAAAFTCAQSEPQAEPEPELQPEPEPEPMDIDEEPTPVAFSEHDEITPITEAIVETSTSTLTSTSISMSTSTSTSISQSITQEEAKTDVETQETEKEELSSVTASLTAIQHQHQPEAEVPQELLEPTSSETSETPECATETPVALDTTVEEEHELINQTAQQDEHEYKTCASLSVSEQCPEEPMEVDGLPATQESKHEELVSAAVEAEAEAETEVKETSEAVVPVVQVPDHSEAADPNLTGLAELAELTELNGVNVEKVPEDVVDGAGEETRVETLESTVSSETTEALVAALDDPPNEKSVQLGDASVEPVVSAVSTESTDSTDANTVNTVADIEVQSLEVPLPEETMPTPQSEAEPEHEPETEPELELALETMAEEKSTPSTVEVTPPESIDPPVEDNLENLENLEAVAPVAAPEAPEVAHPVEMDARQDTRTDALFENEHEKVTQEATEKTEGISKLLNDWDDTDSQTSEQGSKAATVNTLINDWDDE